LLLDRKIAAEERESVLAHIGSCRDCSTHYEAMQALRAELRKMEQRTIPAYLAERLRVLASHERVRRLSRVTLSARARHWAARMQLTFDNLMRPMALPFAGGVLSALVMFAMLVPSLAFPHNFRNDVPLWMIYTNPALEEMSPVDPSEETVVELTIDERGSVQAYTVKQGELTPEMENKLIMFSRFAPATLFGQRTWGKALVSFRRSQISVIG
jgi:hypothetical protein